MYTNHTNLVSDHNEMAGIYISYKHEKDARVIDRYMFCSGYTKLCIQFVLYRHENEGEDESGRIHGDTDRHKRINM